MRDPPAATPASTPIIGTAPSFVVGPDGQGHWLAVETHGLGGGIFVTRVAALDYARAETGRRPAAVLLTLEPIVLR